MRRLTETYSEKYRDPKACDAEAAEEAQDTLMKIRKAMATGKPLYPAENDPDRKPDVGEAITAKVTGEKCRGVLTTLELAELELYVAKAWVWWAKNAVEADARSAIEGYKSAERAIANGWNPNDCTAAAIGKAKKVAALCEQGRGRQRPLKAPRQKWSQPVWSRVSGWPSRPSMTTPVPACVAPMRVTAMPACAAMAWKPSALAAGTVASTS